MIKIVFVCYGNICRSPALEAVLQQIVDQRGLSNKILIQSRGIDTSFLGCNIDARMRQVLEEHHIPYHHKACLFSLTDFEFFDYIFVVTKELLEYMILKAVKEPLKEKIHLATHYSNNFYDQDILDPYYDRLDGFKKCFEIINESCQGIVNFLEKELEET